jgi:hypothetical protein
LKYKQNETVEEENTEEVINSNEDDDNSIGKEQESIREEMGFDLSDSGQKIPPEDESTIQEDHK